MAILLFIVSLMKGAPFFRALVDFYLALVLRFHHIDNDDECAFAQKLKTQVAAAAVSHRQMVVTWV